MSNDKKYCPFKLTPGYSDPFCYLEDCQFWSDPMKMCSIVIGLNGILSISDALRGLSEHIKSYSPEE